jgi:hypothetical protein
VSVNATRAAADVTDAAEVAAATERMRHDIPVIVEIFREAEPAFHNAFVAQTAEATGFRECRELKALHRITTDEFLSGEDVPDAIALAAHPMDRHATGSNAQSLTFLKRPGVIPLSALIAAKCPNLLAAGGLVAAEPEVFASIRVQAQCMATGQAAGVAAAEAAKRGISVQALNRPAIRKLLEAVGVETSASGASSMLG